MTNTTGSSTFSIINLVFKAYQGLKELCDPAHEGNPYKIDSIAESPSFSTKKPVFFFRRLGLR